MNDNKKLGVIALAGVVISAMLGGGVITFPKTWPNPLLQVQY